MIDWLALFLAAGVFGLLGITILLGKATMPRLIARVPGQQELRALDSQARQELEEAIRRGKPSPRSAHAALAATRARFLRRVYGGMSWGWAILTAGN